MEFVSKNDIPAGRVGRIGRQQELLRNIVTTLREKGEQYACKLKISDLEGGKNAFGVLREAAHRLSEGGQIKDLHVSKRGEHVFIYLETE